MSDPPNREIAFRIRFSLFAFASFVRACERSCASAGEMLPLRLVVLEFERSASPSVFFLCFCCVLRGFYKVLFAFCGFLLCFCCVLRGFYGLFFAFVFVCAVFYVGFKRFFIVKSVVLLCFCYVLRGFYGLSFCYTMLFDCLRLCFTWVLGTIS